MRNKLALMASVMMSLHSSSSIASRAVPQTPDMTDELVSFGSCKELEAHVNKLLASNPVPHPYPSNGWETSEGDVQIGSRRLRNEGLAAPAVGIGMMPQAESKAAVEERAADDFTGTNNQVEKVDEADFVKFNGKHIYQIHNGALKVLKAWPANEMSQIASLALTGHTYEMLLNDSYAVVLANHGQRLKATVINITQPQQPKVATEFDIPGQYRTARLIGDTLRIVNQDDQSLQTVWSEEKFPSQNEWLQEQTATRKLSLKPTTQIVDGVQRTLDTVKDCKNVHVPKSSTPTVLTRLISIDLKAKKFQETMAFVQAQTVYASESSIYLAQAGYLQSRNTSLQHTVIHKFLLPQGETALYQASGVVKGHLINQFAMDEHKGNLRIATNGMENTAVLPWGGQWEQVSRVQVLAPVGTKLRSIGQTPDLAKGERLYSARFDGDRAFVVTFRQVDPLFTIDLKNPYRPRVIGELKVPGFSTYIHMMDDKHLLTIGQDADEQTGRQRGLKLSIFDVTDFSKPKEVKSLIFKSGVASESSYEHKAFGFHRAKGVLAIPASQTSMNGSERTSLLLFNVSTKDIKAAGEVSMTDLQSVRRSFFAENVVYAIGGTGVRAASVGNPKSPLGTVIFDQSVADLSW